MHSNFFFKYVHRDEINMSGKEAYKLIITALSGLLHLHTRIDTGVKYSNKPSIAHRDIKSKNILVTENLACVVADFGMAVTQNDIKDMISSKYEDSDTKIQHRILVGTKRYMSPEVLDER